MPEGVNPRKCIRACARGIVYTSKKDPRALALHLRPPRLRAVPVEGPRLSPWRVSGLRRQGLRQRGRTPARTRLDLPVKSSSTAPESVRLRPSPRVLQGAGLAFLRSLKNGPSNKRVTKCTENPLFRGGWLVKMAPFFSGHGVPEDGTRTQGEGVKISNRHIVQDHAPSFGKDISRFWGSKPHDGL